MFTSQMSFIAEPGKTRVPCYRVLQDTGVPTSGEIHKLVCYIFSHIYNTFTLQNYLTFIIMIIIIIVLITRCLNR